MYKLRQTWVPILPARKLYALDVRVNQIDPAWPVAPLPDREQNKTKAEPTSPGHIHVNPKFLQQKASRSAPTAEVNVYFMHLGRR